MSKVFEFNYFIKPLKKITSMLTILTCILGNQYASKFVLHSNSRKSIKFLKDKIHVFLNSSIFCI